MKSYFVYIVKCSDKSYYTGITNNLVRRLNEHNFGIEKKSYTFSRRPVKLKFSEMFNDPKSATQLEKQIKGWNRKKKEALFKRDWVKIVELSNLN